MTIDRATVAAATVLHNPGKRSAQLVWPEAAPDARATITRVTMDPGSVSSRHRHPRSEQIWIVEAGEALLLSETDEVQPMRAGDIIRTPPGDVHGIENTGSVPFVYLTVTTPPEDMRSFYVDRNDR
ncbi:cupin domain-containing protein [Methylobacterium sp. E-005]|uniref:cupin domain-containing protein n=1 Tax=Methylobacterium sp. E-005 TaxID=2836549 RepID=UPI001FBB28CB|nr:cupin domain-containing protein [Methylobacterium sp. E-005]MCJ2087639.1 cupin domain-containing protein [Methylobacterium sp. E-005]